MSLNKNWTTITKPEKVLFESISDHCTKIIMSPLERGFGTTIGNSLRRILLSSLRGSAIVAIEVPGVLHEFSPIPGVEEDMINLILNLKEVSVILKSEERKSVPIKVKGPKTITAGMLSVKNQVHIMNPEQVICNVTNSSVFEMNLIFDNGKGYVPADKFEQEEKIEKLGRIRIDAIFSPITRVSFKVEDARVGQSIGYDKLIMQVESNGTVSPETAIGISAKILQDQLDPFISFNTGEKEELQEKQELPFSPVLLRKIQELDMSVRSQNCLNNVNIVYIGDLVIKTETEMLKTSNFGRKSLNEIKEILSSMGLNFGMKLDWPPKNLENLAEQYKVEQF